MILPPPGSGNHHNEFARKLVAEENREKLYS